MTYLVRVLVCLYFTMMFRKKDTITTANCSSFVGLLLGSILPHPRITVTTPSNLQFVFHPFLVQVQTLESRAKLHSFLESSASARFFFFLSGACWIIYRNQSKSRSSWLLWFDELGWWWICWVDRKIQYVSMDLLNCFPQVGWVFGCLFQVENPVNNGTSDFRNQRGKELRNFTMKKWGDT